MLLLDRFVYIKVLARFPRKPFGIVCELLTLYVSLYLIFSLWFIVGSSHNSTPRVCISMITIPLVSYIQTLYNRYFHRTYTG